MKRLSLNVTTGLFLIVSLSTSIVGQTITYQGRLSDGIGTIDGLYDFEFVLFDDLVSGDQVGTTSTVSDVTVQDGLFTAEMNFGVVDYSQPLWLEINAKEDATVLFGSPLSPRVALRANPLSVTTLGIQGVPVSSTSPVDGDVLQYNSALNQYEPVQLNSSTVTTGRFNWGASNVLADRSSYSTVATQTLNFSETGTLNLTWLARCNAGLSGTSKIALETGVTIFPTTSPSIVHSISSINNEDDTVFTGTIDITSTGDTTIYLIHRLGRITIPDDGNEPRTNHAGEAVWTFIPDSATTK